MTWKNVSELIENKSTLYVERSRKRKKDEGENGKKKEERRKGSKKEYRRKKKASFKMIIVVTLETLRRTVISKYIFSQALLNFTNFP